MDQLTPQLSGARVMVKARSWRPPMERQPSTVALFARARTIAATMGLALAEASTGGASDGNFAASIGTPVLDGLGPEGEGAHADTEHVLTRSLPARAALVGGLLDDL